MTIEMEQDEPGDGAQGEALDLAEFFDQVAAQRKELERLEAHYTEQQRILQTLSTQLAESTRELEAIYRNPLWRLFRLYRRGLRKLGRGFQVLGMVLRRIFALASRPRKRGQRFNRNWRLNLGFVNLDLQLASTARRTLKVGVSAQVRLKRGSRALAEFRQVLPRTTTWDVVCLPLLTGTFAFSALNN